MTSEPAPLTAGGDPLDYAAYIVYVKRKGGAINEQLRCLCADYPELVLQHVEDISPQDRPSWLRGVPTVVQLPSYAISVGTPALDQVKTWASKRPKAVGQKAAPGTGVPLEGSFSAPLAAEGDAEIKSSSLEDLLRRRSEGMQGQQQSQA